MASCVTTPDVKRATKVWFGFSDIQWTPAVIERHKDAAYRAKHMVCLDVQAWLGSKQHKGAADISQVDKLVAEYADSGAVYTASFNQCIESTQDKGAQVRHQNADFSVLAIPLPYESTSYARHRRSFVVATL